MILQGDCREVLATLDAESVDACVTDPPYELGFMGKAWDRSGVAFDPATWAAVLRVLKPGAHLLAFGGTRTYHRMVCAIEDAGFEIRDQLQWLYGSGFPKSLDVSKAIDKVGGYAGWAAFRKELAKAIEASGLTFSDIDRALGVKSTACYWVRGDHRACFPARHHWQALTSILPMSTDLARLHGLAEREVVRAGKPKGKSRGIYGDFAEDKYNYTAPATDAARQWDGWGTALKPANEPICLARKPLVGTVAANVLEHGTGALNIDECRIGTEGGYTEFTRKTKGRAGWSPAKTGVRRDNGGRWPANVLLDEEAARLLDEQTGESKSPSGPVRQGGHHRHDVGLTGTTREGFGVGYGDSGGASRFFYVAKPSRPERGEGNTHPTVKPVDLLRYLLRLVTPPGGVVLDPFAGSGTTLIAAQEEGFRHVGIELNPDYIAIAERRLAQGTLWTQDGAA